MDGNIAHLSGIRKQKSALLPSKGTVVFLLSRPTLLHLHTAQSDLWIDLGETDLEKSGCEHVEVGGRHPVALIPGQSWEHLEGRPLPEGALCFRVSLVSECGVQGALPLSQALAASKEDLVWALPLFLLKPQFPPLPKGEGRE